MSQNTVSLGKCHDNKIWKILHIVIVRNFVVIPETPSKTGRFLSKAEILGAGVFSLLSTFAIHADSSGMAERG